MMKKRQRKWSVRKQTNDFKHSKNNLSNITYWTWNYNKLCYNITFKHPVALISYLFRIINATIINVQLLWGYCHILTFHSFLLIINTKCFGHSGSPSGILRVANCFTVLSSYQVEQWLRLKLKLKRLKIWS
jgi:hypothetical protein